MPVSYTNRKGVTYTLYRGQTRTGKPRYYFGRPGQSQGDPVTELPPGYMISESVNGVVSLAKDRPALIQPEEVAVVEAAVQLHPQARRYRVAVKGNQIEVYEQVGPDYNALVSELHIPGLSRPGLAEELRDLGQSWPVRSSPRWVPSSSLNSGEPAANPGAIRAHPRRSLRGRAVLLGRCR